MEGSKQWCLSGLENRAVSWDEGSIPLPSSDSPGKMPGLLSLMHCQKDDAPRLCILAQKLLIQKCLELIPRTFF